MDVIVDIDGTVADCSHRLHMIRGPKKDFDGFHRACPADPPIGPVVRLVAALAEDQHALLFVTGRPESSRAETEAWLDRHGLRPDMLLMRADGDYRPDYEVKLDALREIRARGYDPRLAIEDRTQVVQMWRREGLICLQCAEGDY